MTPEDIRLLLGIERELEAHARQRARVVASLLALPDDRDMRGRRDVDTRSATAR
jgi:hypothetical protein